MPASSIAQFSFPSIIEVRIASLRSAMNRAFASPSALKPLRMSSNMSSVLSVRLLSLVTMILSAYFSATAAISGLLVLSLSPPQPNTQMSSLSQEMSLRVESTFSIASGVWA